MVRTGPSDLYSQLSYAEYQSGSIGVEGDKATLPDLVRLSLILSKIYGIPKLIKFYFHSGRLEFGEGNLKALKPTSKFVKSNSNGKKVSSRRLKGLWLLKVSQNCDLCI